MNATMTLRQLHSRHIWQLESCSLELERSHEQRSLISMPMQRSQMRLK